MKKLTDVMAIPHMTWVRWAKNNYLTLRSKVKVPRRSFGSWHTALWSCIHIPNIIDLVHDTPPYGHAPTYQISLTYPWHTALWLCTHILNIIDLSEKTKKLWSGQASLRRSGSGRRRKNQTKTICLPSFEGET